MRIYSRKKGWRAEAAAQLPRFSPQQITAKVVNLKLRDEPIGFIPPGILMDAADRERALYYCWRIGDSGYPIASVGGKSVRLHRFIMKPGHGSQVDHINGDRLDNRRSNLRVVFGSENSHNTLARANSKTGIKNVYYYAPGTLTKNESFAAQICVAGKRHHIGLFKTAEDARLAVTRWRQAHIPNHDKRVYGLPE